MNPLNPHKICLERSYSQTPFTNLKNIELLYDIHLYYIRDESKKTPHVYLYHQINIIYTPISTHLMLSKQKCYKPRLSPAACLPTSLQLAWKMYLLAAFLRHSPGSMTCGVQCAPWEGNHISQVGFGT